jgi:hypothetical protein
MPHPLERITAGSRAHLFDDTVYNEFIRVVAEWGFVKHNHCNAKVAEGELLRGDGRHVPQVYAVLKESNRRCGLPHVRKGFQRAHLDAAVVWREWVRGGENYVAWNEFHDPYPKILRVKLGKAKNANDRRGTHGSSGREVP